tara:strand:+ start:3195 stop:3689 length:495 start_codon:yes stop_codon:yes gene_type:complete
MNNISLFVSMTILGVCIIGTYIHYIRKSSSDLVNKMWVGIPKKYRPIYMVMMILATIGFLSFVFYTTTSKIKNYKLVVFSVLLILVPAIFWMGSTYHSLKNNTYSWIVPMVLVLTGIGAIILSGLLYLNRVNHIIQLLFLLFTLHVTILDGYIWNYKYISLYKN